MDTRADNEQMILVRTRAASPEATELAAQLAQISGARTILLVDAREAGAPRDVNMLAMTREEDARLSLYAPKDVGWRCGDYGFYAARTRFPEVTHYWMIEDDVRLGGDGAAFFAHAALFPDIDFLASHIQPADRGWWWYGHALSRNAVPWRSFFPVTRLSARAADRLLLTRQRQSRCWNRRALWPNDEAFVATTIAALGLKHADLNGLGQTFYDPDTFGYTQVVDPAQIPATGVPRLFHPVLDAPRRVQRDARLQKAERRPTLHRRGADYMLKLLNSATRW